MQKEIVVILGGPGTGKSTIIEGLKAMGHCCYPEISRQVTIEAQQKGIDQSTFDFDAEMERGYTPEEFKVEMVKRIKAYPWKK